MRRKQEGTAGTPIPGKTAFYRPGDARRPGEPYTSPDLKIISNQSMADRNNGRLLITGAIGFTPRVGNRNTLMKADTFVMYSQVTGAALIGDISFIADDYDPDTWPHTEYKPAPEWDSPSELCVALDDVRTCKDFNLDQYDVIPSKTKNKRIPLVESINHSTRAIRLIIPWCELEYEQR